MSLRVKIYKKAILPIGFKASAVACGIKRFNKLDLALLYSLMPAKAACSFTTNKMLAAPIKVNKNHLKKNRQFQAILVNSGNANCFTGDAGVKAAQESAHALAYALGIKKEGILLASTGIIGRGLPVNKIKKSLPGLIARLSQRGLDRAKLAIMTTDTFAKEISVKLNIENKLVTICGIAKGAGMIAPNLATMLCFILTDALIAQDALDKALEVCVGDSFNCITVDGCMSTNDSVMVLANGAAGNAAIDRGVNFNLFVEALRLVCLKLAEKVIRDAEGATKFIEIKVMRAKNFKEAKMLALAIANSSLFKTAMYGENPNFGRIAQAIGSSGVDVDEKKLKINLSSLNKEDIAVSVTLNRGRAGAKVYTSDLTPEYVRINAQYN